MNAYNLKVATPSVGGYFSSEQLEFLSIIQCENHEELREFVEQCSQLKGVYSKEEIENFITQDLERLKRKIFKDYQNTLVLHNSDKQTVLMNPISRLNLRDEDIDIIKKAYAGKNYETIRYMSEYIRSKYPSNYEELFKQIHCFVSTERDQNKADNLYDEFVLINENLSMFDTLLIGSGKPEIVINDFFYPEEEGYFDFYFADRDLEFAKRNNKHIRLHSLLTKGACEQKFIGRSREEIIEVLTAYVQKTIDFINEYNGTHKLKDGTPVIQSLDLFNEIVSFDKNKEGKYENIWEARYGITLSDICNIFEYAKKNKPEGVHYLYNEPFLEDGERRAKVLEVLQEINSISDGLIDTIGSQMHITFSTSDEQIAQCFHDFKRLQDKQNLNVQITEFDLSLSERETLKTLGENPLVTYEQVYDVKTDKIQQISSVIQSSEVRLDGVSYWSLTDNIDCNLERVRTNLLTKGLITNIHQVPTSCGGLIPTFKQQLNTMTHQTESIVNEHKL